MTTTVASTKTELGPLVGNELTGGLPVSDRDKVVWLTAAELEANWRRGELASPLGTLAAPAEFMVYQGGNGGDESFIPIHIVRGYD